GTILQKASAVFDLSINFKKPEEFAGMFELQQSFIDSFKIDLKNAADVLQKETQAKINQLSQTLKDFQSSLQAGAALKIDQLDKEIMLLDTEIDTRKPNCDTLLKVATSLKYCGQIAID